MWLEIAGPQWLAPVPNPGKHAQKPGENFSLVYLVGWSRLLLY